MLDSTRARARERAQEEAQRTKQTAQEELGRMLFDIVETYFPEQARSRRRSGRWKLLVVGVVFGMLFARRLLR